MKMKTLLTTLLVLIIVAITATAALADDALEFSEVSINGLEMQLDSESNVLTLPEGTDSIDLKPLEELEVEFKLKNNLEIDEEAVAIQKITVQLVDFDDITSDDFDWHDDVSDPEKVEIIAALTSAELTGDTTNFEDKEQFHLGANGETQRTLAEEINSNEASQTVALLAYGFTEGDDLHYSFKTFDFSVVAETTEIVLSVEELPEDELTCSNLVGFDVILTNTGTVTENDVTLIVREGAKEIKTIENIEIASGTFVKESISTSITGTGTHTLTVEAKYNFIGELPGSMADPITVEVTKESCFKDSFSPEETELTVLDNKNEGILFEIEVNENGFTDINWEVENDGEPVQSANGNTFLFIPENVGTYTVTVSVYGEDSHSWTVTVLDLPTDLADFGVDLDDDVEPKEVELTLTVGDLEVEFAETIDLSDLMTLGEFVKFGSNSVSIDSENAPDLDREATITIDNEFTNPKVLWSEDFDVVPTDICPDTVCVITSEDGDDEFVFTVTGFSTYKVVEEQAATLTVSEINFENANLESDEETTFTVTNTGTFEELTGLSFVISDVDAEYEIALSGNPTSLDPEEEETVTLTIKVPADETSGKHSIGKLTVTGKNSADEELTVENNIYVSTQSFLKITNFEVNGKDNGKLALDEVNDIEIEVQNDYDEDMDEVTVTVKILDVDGDDLKEESEEFDLDKNGGDDSVTLSFDLSEEDLDRDEYTIEIEIEARADDDTDHEYTETRDVDLDLENHNVILSNVYLTTEEIGCSDMTTVVVEVKNVGKSNEDDVEIRVKNSALEIDLKKANIDLDKYTRKNNNERENFELSFDGVAAGTYKIDIDVYRDDKLEDSKEVTLKITDSCTVSSTTTTQTQLTGAELAEQLKLELESKQTVTSDNVVSSSLRESSGYTVLLGFLIVLVFVAFVLGIALIFKKK